MYIIQYIYIDVMYIHVYQYCLVVFNMAFCNVSESALYLVLCRMLWKIVKF